MPSLAPLVVAAFAPVAPLAPELSEAPMLPALDEPSLMPEVLPVFIAALPLAGALMVPLLVFEASEPFAANTGLRVESENPAARIIVDLAIFIKRSNLCIANGAEARLFR